MGRRYTPNTCRVILASVRTAKPVADEWRIEYTPKPCKTKLVNGDQVIISGTSREVAEYLEDLVGPVQL